MHAAAHRAELPVTCGGAGVARKGYNITAKKPHDLSVVLQEDFLNTLRALQPDLCLTAAYGNYLPSKFLSIPKYGTVNIHPSLLPKYRGAAPIQRALQVILLSLLLCKQSR